MGPDRMQYNLSESRAHGKVIQTMLSFWTRRIITNKDADISTAATIQVERTIEICEPGEK